MWRRAVCGMPLGDPSMRVPCAIMINVLGGGAKQDAPTQEELVAATMAPIDVRPSPPTPLPSLLRLAVLKLSGGRATLCLCLCTFVLQFAQGELRIPEAGLGLRGRSWR